MDLLKKKTTPKIPEWMEHGGIILILMLLFVFAYGSSQDESSPE